MSCYRSSKLTEIAIIGEVPTVVGQSVKKEARTHPPVQAGQQNHLTGPMLLLLRVESTYRLSSPTRQIAQEYHKLYDDTRTDEHIF
jgi:hypothetical protein